MKQQRKVPRIFLGLLLFVFGQGLLIQKGRMEGFEVYVRRAPQTGEVPGLTRAVAKNDGSGFGKGYGVGKLDGQAPVDGVAGPDSAGSQPRPQTLEELKRQIQTLLSQNGVPGAGIALVTKDRIIWAGGVGKADLATGQDVTEDTVFRVGSISKSFVALALMKLQEDGRVSLNAKVADIAPEIVIHNPWRETHPVRIVNLLEHTAGFDDMHPNEVYNFDDPADFPLNEAFAKFPDPQFVRWPPGSRMSYSNPGYALAGYVIEKVADQSFEDYIKENILIPLGMTHSSFRLTRANQSLLAQGYEGNPPQPVPYRHIYLRPAGDLKSSAKELALFVQMLLGRGRLGDLQVIQPESLDRMERTETTLAARSGLTHGYGLGIYTDLGKAIATRGHDGGIDGFISSYGYLKNQGLGYVVLLNSIVSRRALSDIRERVFHHLTAQLPRPKQPAVTLTEDELEKFTGYYQSANPRNELLAFMDLLLGGRFVFVKDGVLYQRGLFKAREALIPVARTQFRLEKEPEASLIFCTTEAGTKVLAGGGSYLERVSPWWPMTRIALLVACLILMVSSPLFAVIWIPRRMFSRMKRARHLAVRTIPLLAVLSIAAAFLIMAQASGSEFGTRNIKTVSFWAGTWMFALFSLWGLLLALLSLRHSGKKAARVHSLLVALACCGLGGYLATWHIIGLKLWGW